MADVLAGDSQARQVLFTSDVLRAYIYRELIRIEEIYPDELSRNLQERIRSLEQLLREIQQSPAYDAVAVSSSIDLACRYIAEQEKITVDQNQLIESLTQHGIRVQISDLSASGLEKAEIDIKRLFFPSQKTSLNKRILFLSPEEVEIRHARSSRGIFILATYHPDSYYVQNRPDIDVLKVGHFRERLAREAVLEKLIEGTVSSATSEELPHLLAASHALGHDMALDKFGTDQQEADEHDAQTHLLEDELWSQARSTSHNSSETIFVGELDPDDGKLEYIAIHTLTLGFQTLLARGLFSFLVNIQNNPSKSTLLTTLFEQVTDNFNINPSLARGIVSKLVHSSQSPEFYDLIELFNSNSFIERDQASELLSLTPEDKTEMGQMFHLEQSVKQNSTVFIPVRSGTLTNIEADSLNSSVDSINENEVLTSSVDLISEIDLDQPSSLEPKVTQHEVVLDPVSTNTTFDREADSLGPPIGSINEDEIPTLANDLINETDSSPKSESKQKSKPDNSAVNLGGTAIIADSKPDSLDQPVNPIEDGEIPTPTVDADPISNSVSIDAIGGNNLIPVSDYEANIVIHNFGGIGRGIEPTDEILDELDVIQFEGEKFVSENLFFQQGDSDLIIRFFDLDEFSITLVDFTLELIDNIPFIKSPSGFIGNILFHGEQQIQDSFDVANSDIEIEEVLDLNQVNFLNELNNLTYGHGYFDDISSDDIIHGLGGDDQLIGGWGRDRLYGGAGNDLLKGGLDDDLLSGGTGQDIFVLAADGSQDTLVDFTIGEDILLLSGNLYPDHIAFQATESSGDSTLVVNLATNTVLAELLGVTPEMIQAYSSAISHDSSL